ncbi:hypothetical protein BST95_09030 [Halioglobus japonicus]|uniref:Uncharacterized protein n=1 Tax=Halioglobus japonicus TaxID=930805 RepID=A0AAP8SN89_9GAMM|nr:hypothetical protein [Halioglobus japonicus]AQA18354.1 hypothetical protein BST95_09030 [Halioglobus japonicus]PLW86372.1 hypothetical protein C0029_08070 [Halioglobus japonicus]GHD13225.1 hypothetical protein GCM10007052_15120 [Halioglobus japonicus]
MRDRTEYLDEVESRLRKLFKASKDGYKASPQQRHRLEGFIQAGTFIGIASGQEMETLMDMVHQEVFGMTIQERNNVTSEAWASETIDYSEYEAPTYDRKT